MLSFCHIIQLWHIYYTIIWQSFHILNILEHFMLFDWYCALFSHFFDRFVVFFSYLLTKMDYLFFVIHLVTVSKTACCVIVLVVWRTVNGLKKYDRDTVPRKKFSYLWNCATLGFHWWITSFTLKKNQSKKQLQTDINKKIFDLNTK